MHSQPPPRPPRSARTVVVIDVLRMTTTASVLLRRPSCACVVVAATLDDVERLSLPLSEHVLVSELPRAPGLGVAWIDNSPSRAARFDFKGRTPVLVTTNGTKTLFAAAARGERVLLASFRDLRAVARHLAEDELLTVAEPGASGSSVMLMPAGHVESGESRLEDDLCADALASLLAGREPDLEACAAAIRADARVVRRIEKEPGFAADVDLALENDPLASVLEFLPLDAGVGHVVPVSRAWSSTAAACGPGAGAPSSAKM